MSKKIQLLYSPHTFIAHKIWARGGPPDNTASEGTEEDVKNKSEIKQAASENHMRGNADKIIYV